MLEQDHLTLRSTRLKNGDVWSQKRQGLHFLLARGGAGQYVSGRITRLFGPGDILVVNSGTDGKVLAANGQDLEFWVFAVSLEHLFPLFEGREISLLHNVCERLKATNLYPAATSIATKCHHLAADVPPEFTLDHRGQLLRIAAAVLNEEFKNAQPSCGGFNSMDEHLLQVFEKLTSNELLELSVGDLASRFGCSRRHLNRLFHQCFGFSVGALRMEMRLLKAVSLLRDPGAKVINVAEQCLFNYVGLFNRCFKKRFGTSPGQWRKLTSKPGDEARALVDSPPLCPYNRNGLCPWTGPVPVPDPRTSIGTSAQIGRAPPRGPARKMISADGFKTLSVGVKPKPSGDNCRDITFQVRS